MPPPPICKRDNSCSTPTLQPAPSVWSPHWFTGVTSSVPQASWPGSDQRPEQSLLDPAPRACAGPKAAPWVLCLQPRSLPGATDPSALLPRPASPSRPPCWERYHLSPCCPKEKPGRLSALVPLTSDKSSPSLGLDICSVSL